MHVSTYLSAPSYAHGALRDIAEIPELTRDSDLLEVLRAVGLSTYAPVDREELVQLCVTSVRKTLEHADVAPSQVQAIVYASTCYFTGAAANDPAAPGELLRRVVEALGMRNALPYGANFVRCVNSISALEIAQGLIARGACEHVLVLAGDSMGSTFTRIVDPGVSVVSDVASSFLVSHRPLGPAGYEIEDVQRSVDWELATIDARENFPEFLRRTAAGIRAATAKIYQRGGAGAERYSQLITNTVNRSVVRIFSQASGIPVAKIYSENVARLGHCDVSDLIINLADYGPSAQAGQRILAVANGPYVWGAMSLKVC